MTKAEQPWPQAVAAAALVTILLGAVFWSTVSSMVQQWLEVETYSHGFMILPISLWLVWRQRDQVRCLQPRPAPVALLVVLLAGGVWLLAGLLGVLVVEQLALVSLWIAALWAVLGHRLASRLLFPLLFLLTMVPMGDGLVPPMMDFTADFTVWMLEMTGIPVYREGLYFVIPSGNWSVVEACSGVRYLVASITLGLLYAHLTYHSLWRQALFVLLSALVPVLANGLRAYMIVMIGHFSDMQLAVGVDHLIYGWVFFGVIMLLLFWLGGFWVDAAPAATAQEKAQKHERVPLAGSVAVLASVLVIGLGLRSASASLGSGADTAAAPFELPASISGWQLVEDPTDWPARVPAADQLLHGVYRRDGDTVVLKLGLFRSQQQGREVVSSDNKLLDDDGTGWRVIGSAAVQFADESRPAYLLARQSRFLIGETQQQLLATSWYRLGRHDTANSYLAKLYQGISLITSGRNDGAFVLLATEMQADAGRVLADFSRQALPQVWSEWDRHLLDGKTAD
jgi:exosortase A